MKNIFAEGTAEGTALLYIHFPLADATYYHESYLVPPTSCHKQKRQYCGMTSRFGVFTCGTCGLSPGLGTVGTFIFISSGSEGHSRLASRFQFPFLSAAQFLQAGHILSRS
jgi:hypothetical protein